MQDRCWNSISDSINPRWRKAFATRIQAVSLVTATGLNSHYTLLSTPSSKGNPSSLFSFILAFAASPLCLFGSIEVKDIQRYSVLIDCPMPEINPPAGHLCICPEIPGSAATSTPAAGLDFCGSILRNQTVIPAKAGHSNTWWPSRCRGNASAVSRHITETGPETLLLRQTNPQSPMN
ncbi:MAG: hypothetical protein R6V75_09025 [Bacteroidales bacterium]